MLTDASASFALIAPEVVKSVGRELGVPDRVLNILVSQVVLDGSCIMTIIGKLEPASMPQHVRMNRKPDTRPFTGPSDDLTHSRGGQRTPAFGHEDVRPGIVPL